MGMVSLFFLMSLYSTLLHLVSFPKNSQIVVIYSSLSLLLFTRFTVDVAFSKASKICKCTATTATSERERPVLLLIGAFPRTETAFPTF